MKNNITDPLETFNQLYKKMDEIYHQYAKMLGIPDMRLWLLYSLYESSKVYTQKEFCSDWHYPPQTVNSSLKSLEEQEIIKLEHSTGNLKNKQIILTEKGSEYMQKVVSPLVSAEQKAFRGLKNEEREALLFLTQKYIDLLQNEVGNIQDGD